MSSKKIEDYHERKILQILKKYGLLVDLTPVTSTESSHSTIENVGEEFHIAEEEKKVEEEVKEEAAAVEEEEVIEALTFPTPSLRRVLPERLRVVESFNAIHVLPDVFILDFAPEDIPHISKSTPQIYLDKLAELLGCVEYKTSLPEYWFLDTVANLIRKGQEDGMDRTNQKILIAWFCELMKEIQHFDAADRNRMMMRFEEVFLKAAHFISQGGKHIPFPLEIDVSYYNLTEPVPLASLAESVLKRKKLTDGVREASYTSNMKNLTRIIHHIYDVFSTDFQFELIRQVFTERPENKYLNLPFRLNRPKPALKVEKPAKPAKPKKEKETKKGAAKGKATTVEPEEYLHMMEIRRKESEELRLIEEKEAADLKLRQSMLPVSMAEEVNEKLFLSYWPEDDVTTADTAGGKKKNKK